MSEPFRHIQAAWDKFGFDTPQRMRLVGYQEIDGFCLQCARHDKATEACPAWGFEVSPHGRCDSYMPMPKLGG